MNPQPLPILTNVGMAVAAAQSTGALLVVVLEANSDPTAAVSTSVHGAAAAASAGSNLPPLTLRIVAQSHEHALFAQVYGQPASVPSVYLLRQGRVLDTLDGAAAADTALVKRRIAQALGIEPAAHEPASEPVIATQSQPPAQAQASSSSSASSITPSKPSQPTARSAQQQPSAAAQPAPAKPRTLPKPTPASAPAPAPAPVTATATATATPTADPDSIALAIRHLDASVSRHSFSLSSTTLAELATLLSGDPYNHADHGLMQSYPTRISLYTSSALLDAPARDTSLSACGLQGPSATLVVRPPFPPPALSSSRANPAPSQVSMADRAHGLLLVVLGWVQAVLMLAVRAWLKVGGHRPAASDPGMAPQATVATGAGHGVPDPEVVRRRRLQTLADLNARESGEDKGPVEAYNGNSTSHEQ